jgi:hypothetical protein
LEGQEVTWDSWDRKECEASEAENRTLEKARCKSMGSRDKQRDIGQQRGVNWTNINLIIDVAGNEPAGGP